MTDVALRSFDPQRAGREELAAFTAFSNRLRAEAWPEDAPRSQEATARRLRSTPPFVVPHRRLIWSGGQVIAAGNVTFWEVEDNRHAAALALQVLPERRRRGLARLLLADLLGVVRVHGRRLLLAEADSVVPAGAAFLERLGGSPGLAQRVSQLDLETLDRSRLEAWIARAPERAAGFDLLRWGDEVPEAQLQAYVRLQDLMNTAPRDDLEVEDMRFTGEQLRQMEASRRRRGVRAWTRVAVHRGSGEMAGFTEIFWDPEEPELLDQGATAVEPRFRNRGLGRWLKAAMLLEVLEEVPLARRVRTGNARSNEPMLKINEEMGFRPYKAITLWQLPVDRAAAYLEGVRH